MELDTVEIWRARANPSSAISREIRKRNTALLPNTPNRMTEVQPAPPNSRLIEQRGTACFMNGPPKVASAKMKS